jgi:hypothetical protein
LHYACSHDNLELLEGLMVKMALAGDVLAMEDQRGYTALHVATHLSSAEVGKGEG